MFLHFVALFLQCSVSHDLETILMENGVLVCLQTFYFQQGKYTYVKFIPRYTNSASKPIA